MLGVTPGQAAANGTGNTVRFQKLRLMWEQSRKTMRSEIGKLRDGILAQSSDEDNYSEIQTGVSRLDEILSVLDDRLSDELDELYTSEDQTARRALMSKARKTVIEYATFVASDPLMRAIDANPFTPVQVASTAVASLQSLQAELG